MSSIALPVLLSLAPARGATIRVPFDRPDLASALAEAQGGDEVLVAPGEYVIDEPLELPGRRITLRSEEGPAVTVIRMAESPRDPGRACVLSIVRGEGPETVIEGFTITGGKGDAGKGGGILVRDASPTIRGNWILANEAAEAGGGIYIEYPRGLLLEGNRIEGNRAGAKEKAGSGGGIYVRGIQTTDHDEAPWLRIARCQIEDNRASQGAGLCLKWVGGKLLDNEIIRNRGDAGAGLYWDNEDSSSAVFANVEGCEIAENVAEVNGGGIVVTPGKWSQSFIRNCTIERNRAEERGGGIYLPFGLRVWIEKNRIEGNMAGLDGGGLYVENRDDGHNGMTRGVSVERNVFFRNVAGHTGGGACLGQVGTSRFDFNTVVANVAEKQGGGISMQWLSSRHPGYAAFWLVANSITWGNDASYNPDLDPGSLGGWYKISYCLVGYYELIATVGGHHYEWRSTDPQFVDLEGGDLHLLRTSPAIDAGHPAAPLDPDGTRADMGAFWYPHKTTFVRGDADGDGALALGDAILVLEYLFAGRSVSCPKACDIDDSGSVELNDPIRLLGYLFAGGPQPQDPFPEEGEDVTFDDLRCVR